ncbi:hypothetical protein KUV41_11425 [Halomonas sp. DP8Y7-1]|uniref:hypothetical protein n=1 Tax=Halomonas sp. DP8Y7-1 TaxID=2859078 RepID=UPI001C94C34B|nr:hypothetical protein [Halomonas sp. DP8Y7-1]MBY6029967.1 hypothetical protein [Halomonas sp. DP8Y7-1]
MIIVFKAVTSAPDQYLFDGEKVNAYSGYGHEEYDLSNFPEGGGFVGASNSGSGPEAILGVVRENGQLKLTLAQQVIPGQYPKHKAHWRESPIIDAADYDPNKCYVVPTGMAGVDDYEIVQGVDVAGNTGWTVRKKEMADG